MGRVVGIGELVLDMLYRGLNDDDDDDMTRLLHSLCGRYGVTSAHYGCRYDRTEMGSRASDTTDQYIQYLDSSILPLPFICA